MARDPREPGRRRPRDVNTAPIAAIDPGQGKDNRKGKRNDPGDDQKADPCGGNCPTDVAVCCGPGTNALCCPKDRSVCCGIDAVALCCPKDKAVCCGTGEDRAVLFQGILFLRSRHWFRWSVSSAWRCVLRSVTSAARGSGARATTGRRGPNAACCHPRLVVGTAGEAGAARRSTSSVVPSSHTDHRVPRRGDKSPLRLLLFLGDRGRSDAPTPVVSVPTAEIIPILQ